MSAEIESAYNFALELTKQLITLSTAILTLTIALTKDFAKQLHWSARLTLATAWIFFFLSIENGIQHLMALTGGMESLAQYSASGAASQTRNRLLDSIARVGIDPFPDSTLVRNGLMISPAAYFYGNRQVWFFLWGLKIIIAYGAFVLLCSFDYRLLFGRFLRPVVKHPPSAREVATGPDSRSDAGS